MIIGEHAARAVVALMFVLQYVVIGYLVAIGFFSPPLLVVLLALPKMRDAIVIFRRPKPASRPAEYPADACPLWFVAYAFAHNRRWGLLFLVGLVADVIARAVI